MKKLLFIVLLYFLFISCLSKHYVWNSQNKPRPTPLCKFSLDNNSLTADINSIIDTNSIYITTSYKRMLPGITAVFYRFFSNGSVYEIVLKGEPIDLDIIDTAMGNFGKYRIVESNKIKMEFLRETTNKVSLQREVTNSLVYAKIVGEDLLLTPKHHSKEKGFHDALSGGGSGFGYGAILIGTIFLVDEAIPDKKVVFYKVEIKNLKEYLANH